MNTSLLKVLVALVLVAASAWAADNQPADRENTILSLILKRSYSDGSYTVVSPEARLSHMDADNSEQVRQSKKYIQENLQATGTELAKLIDRLFERNRRPIPLSIKSSPNDGYIIDYDGKYGKYFDHDGGGWEKWYQENPKARGMTTVSLPVYDEKSGLVLVYKGTQTHWLAGTGWIILYRYEKGELKELNKVMMWIS